MLPCGRQLSLEGIGVQTTARGPTVVRQLNSESGWHTRHRLQSPQPPSQSMIVRRSGVGPQVFENYLFWPTVNKVWTPLLYDLR